MDLKSDRELANTRRKLQGLEELYQETLQEPVEDALLREAELDSLLRLINQFKEEIARYEARRVVRS
jgi:hypothetical protein